MQRLADRVTWAVAAPVAVWLSYAIHRSDDMFIIVGLTFVFACVCGTASPGRAWKWGFLWGIAPAAVGLLLVAAGVRLKYLTSPGQPTPALVLLVPAFFGAYAGAVVRNVVAPGTPDPAGSSG